MKEIFILIGVGVIGILVIAIIVTFQFAQQQDDRQKSIKAAKESEQKTQEYRTCLEQNKDSESMKDLRLAEKLLESSGKDVEPYQPCLDLLK